MKKIRLLLVLIFSYCVISAENVAFLKTGGTGDGLSPASPTGSINTAYKILEDAGGGGTIVLVDKFVISSNFRRAVANTLEVKITSKYNGIDYRDGNPNCALCVGTAGFRFVLNGPHTFDYITFKGNTALTSNYIMFIANYNNITMGEDVVVTDFPSTIMTTSCSILGGAQNGQTGTPVSTSLDTHVTIKSGKFIVVGFNRQITSTYTGTAYIDIQGGEIIAFYGGSILGGTGGNLNLNISGGTFKDYIFAGNRPNSTTSVSSGTTLMEISGGDFNECAAIFGSMDGGSTADLSGSSDFEFIKRRLYYFNNLITATGTVDFLIPNDVFDFGTYTSSSGLEIPYRIYFPEGYNPEQSYPLMLYMHDNGSRGNDNILHLTTAGSAFVSTVLNSNNDCIILAPQCHDSTSWVSIYPGNAGYTVETVEMGNYLNAAKELLSHVVTTNNVDRNRIYIMGSSNGGGATWDLLCRYPDLFAAGVPMAGCGESSNAAAIADLLDNIPIWTFHGDADTTLPVDGTRGIVNAITNIGGEKIKYTEFEGIGHDVWWDASVTEGLVDWLFAQERNDISTSVLNSESDSFIKKHNNLLEITMPMESPLTIYSISGEKVVSKNLSSGDNKISLDILLPGCYILQMNIANHVYTKKLLISNK